MGKWDNIGGGASFGERSRVSCSITNDVAFLENLVAGARGALVVTNKTNVLSNKHRGLFSTIYKETKLFRLCKICKKCNNNLFFKQIVVIFYLVGCFCSMLIEWICYALF